MKVNLTNLLGKEMNNGNHYWLDFFTDREKDGVSETQEITEEKERGSRNDVSFFFLLKSQAASEVKQSEKKIIIFGSQV